MSQISIRGVKDPAKRALIRKATTWMLDELVGKRIWLEVNVQFLDLWTSTRSYGDCEWVGDEFPSREFNVRVDQIQVPLLKQLNTLAHELIHVKQYAKGELYEYVRNNHTRFRNEIHENGHLNESTKSPWEQEAYKNQKKLTRRFLKENRIDLRIYK